jgi:hypothetical protein
MSLGIETAHVCGFSLGSRPRLLQERTSRIAIRRVDAAKPGVPALGIAGNADP